MTGEREREEGGRTGRRDCEREGESGPVRFQGAPGTKRFRGTETPRRQESAKWLGFRPDDQRVQRCLVSI